MNTSELVDNETTHSEDMNTFETLFGDVKGNSSYEALSGSHTFKWEDSRGNGLSKVF
ncbi:hypothetical protein [Peribacillus sp. FSL E2-0218]|uniref:hypothetical protein n=1 Tax=Peribacillus sp. FSL E2-0218 TaxID=2921364 RepID=UPI0030EEC5FB